MGKTRPPFNASALALISLAFAIATFAGGKKQRDWITGTLLSVSKDPETAITSATRAISQAEDIVNRRLQYTVDTAGATYVLKVFNPTPPGSSTRLPPPQVPDIRVGDKVEIAVKKNEAWLLDTAGKEHLCTVLKRIEKLQ